MNPDRLDELLDNSAPPTRAAAPAALRAMSADASRAVPPGRRRRIGIAAGALAVLLIGGAGIATASSDRLWGAGMEDPGRAVAYTSPTWGQCELRIGNLQAANPFQQVGMDQVIDDWFATTEIETEMAPLVEKYLGSIEAMHAADPVAITDPRLPDLDYWLAVDQAVGELLHDELKANGFEGSLASGSSQVHCDGEQWK